MSLSDHILKKKILVVEDNSSIRFALKYELGVDEYEFVMADDVPEARMLLEADRPHLLIIDVMLPSGPNEGFRFCEEVKKSKAMRDIPIIILTARPAQDEILAKAAGADVYFTKPPDIIEFKSTIENLLKRRN